MGLFRVTKYPISANGMRDDLSGDMFVSILHNLVICKFNCYICPWHDFSITVPLVFYPIIT